MMKLLVLSAAAALGLCAPAMAAGLNIDPKASLPLAQVVAEHAPGSCHFRIALNGMRLPDPACTPGAINPTLTADVLNDPSFRTGMVRDKVTSEEAKEIVYSWYGVTKPANNRGPEQFCELDHVVDLASGGADTLDNIWPECQDPAAPAVPVGQREFKIKDRFAEHDVMRLVKEGADLADLQRKIAVDWTQFITPED